jgi:hypothetical protein
MDYKSEITKLLQAVQNECFLRYIYVLLLEMVVPKKVE